MKINTTIRDLAQSNASHIFWDSGDNKDNLFILTNENVCVMDFDFLIKILTGNVSNKTDLFTFVFGAKTDMEKKQNENNTAIKS